MSFFTILITEKKTTPEVKKEVFRVRQKSLSFIEIDEVLKDTKSFNDKQKYSAVILEYYFTSFLKYELSAHEKRIHGDNSTYLEKTFQELSKKYTVAFGFFFDDKDWGGFNEEKIKTFPEEYKEDTLYILNLK